MSTSAFKNLPSSPLLRQVARLNKIAGTPHTAFRFDPLKIREIQLILIQKNVHLPSAGLRNFWKNNLPTLQFHNNDVTFTMTRVATTSKEDLVKVPAKILVHTTDDNTLTLDCLNMKNNKILRELVALTEAKQVPEAEIPIIANPNQ